MSTRRAAVRTGHKKKVQAPWWQSPWLIIGTLVAVTAVVAALLFVGLGGSGSPPPASNDRAPAAVLDAATQPDIAALAIVGEGGASNPFVVPPGSTPLVAADGHQLVAFVSADYCPFCAARRWSLVVALSRFGTFSDLGLTTSSSSDIYPDTSSLSFHGSSYASQYISFAGVETETRDRQPLDAPSAQVANAVAQYDAPPYTTHSGAIPFLDIAGRFISIGGGYSPDLLRGMSALQIASVIRDPSSPVGRAIMADANVITAAICSVTNGQPGSVCGSPPVTQILPTLQGK